MYCFLGSRYTVINKAIEKLIDSKKIHEKFPDYSEVFNVIKQVQDRDDLGFNEIDISNEGLYFSLFSVQLSLNLCEYNKKTF